MKKRHQALGIILPIVVLVLSAAVWKTSDASEPLVSIGGKVTFSGPVQSGELIDMGADAYCASAQATAQRRAQPVATGAGNGLRGAVVFVKEGLTTASNESTEPALLDQKDCMYRPGLVALRTSQPLVVRNSDATLHNVHVYATENRGFNIGQPFQGVESRRNFQSPEVGIEVKCDVHGWMSGSIAVFDHGFFGLTDENGNFTVADLPPGEYVFAAWHPVLGERTQAVTITAVAMPMLSFEFES